MTYNSIYFSRIILYTITLMKFLVAFCSFICLLKPFPTAGYELSKCRKTMHADYDEIIPIKDFLHFLIDFEIYSIADFIKFKEEGLPDGVPDKPLRAYSGLKRDWSNLWRRVNKIREQEQRKEQVLALITENSYISLAEIAATVGLLKRKAKGITNLLKNEGRLARISSSRNGYWEVLKNGAQPSGKDPIEQRRERILSLIRENNKITLPQMARILEITILPVRQAIDKLKKEDQLVRVGSTYGGHWKIPEENTIH